VATLETTLFACAVCGAVGDDLGPGPGGRRAASCRSCGSLERQRLVALLLSAFQEQAARGDVVLDVAPSRQLSPLIRALRPEAYVSIDLDPSADNREVTVAASLTDVPLPHDSVGLLVCFQVLEHIPDDAAAMREIARTLHPDGLALLQVPRRTGVPTDEDPSVGEEERVRRFGQADHVRFYGDDFEDRLRAAGMSVLTMSTSELMPRTWMPLLGIDPGEMVWLCGKAEAPSLDVPAARAAVAGSVIDVLERVARRARAQAAVAATPAPRAPASTPVPASFTTKVRRRLRKNPAVASLARKVRGSA
jgi:SAM-dependent methyltransferase